MLRTAALLSILVAAPAWADDPPPATVQVKGKPLVLSCPEWRRNPDRSWTSTGPLLVGTETVPSATVRGKDAAVLEAKCGGEAGAIPAPAEPAQPGKRKRPPAAAAGQGT